MGASPDYNLFNAADNTLKAYLKQDDFEKSLVFNILFQDKILMHGAYFFDSNLLVRHIKRRKGEITLFEAAAREGLIVPVYWDKNIHTLRENHELMLRIYGKDYKLLHDELDEVTYRKLCDNVDAGRKKQEAFIVPEGSNMGESYYRILKQYLQQEQLPEYIQQNEPRHFSIERYWNLTKKWRYDLIEEALKKTGEKGQPGLQRTELVKLIAREVKLPETVALEAKNVISDFLYNPEEINCVNVFMKWIAQCHHVNMARTLDTAINFPVYSAEEDFLYESIVSNSNESANPSTKSFECTVKLPSPYILVQENFENLLAIRRELGTSYLMALQEWQRNPEEKNLQLVKMLFVDYCNNIYERYKKVPVRLKASYFVGNNLFEKGLDAVGAVLSIKEPLIGMYMAIGKLGFALYECYSDYQKFKPREATLEINLSESVRQGEKIHGITQL